MKLEVGNVLYVSSGDRMYKVSVNRIFNGMADVSGDEIMPHFLPLEPEGNAFYYCGNDWLIATPELDEEFKRENLIRRIKHIDFDKMTTEALESVNERIVVKDGY
jgi:hypothetical protein